MTDPLRDRIHRGEEGLAGASLVIVIAWALAAVLMLTGTLVAAQQIDERVFEIRNLVTDIGDGTQHVALTQEINESAAGILDAAAPLSAQLDDVIASAGSIDGTVTQILGTAGEINSVAAGQINPNVLAIGGSEAGIRGSVDSIHGSFVALLPVVQDINQGIADINQRVDVVLGEVHGIKGDTGAIVSQVGIGPQQNTIQGHAHSIDCHAVIRLLSLDPAGLLAGLLGGGGDVGTC